MRTTKKRRIVAAFCILTALLLLFLFLNTVIGSVRVSPKELADIFAGRDPDGTKSRIIMTIRLPRLIAAAILGGALAVSGFLMQTFFSNPIAGPFVLGISSGAKLTVAIAMIGSLETGRTMTSGAMVLSAFAGAIMSMGVILLLSGRVRSMSVLVICGVMTGYICSAITDFVVTFADDSNIVNLHNWSRGSFSGIGWANVSVMAPVTMLAVMLAFLLSKPMGAYQMGEVYAANLGVNLKAFRICLILLSSVLAACVTAFAGPVSFLGVASPHLMKRLLGTARPIVMIPACFMGGAVFCLLCDLVARTLFSPTELSISTVTAVFGAPVVIAVMLQRRKERIS
ncbi:MAG: iron ABC transporter permease [Lachnospiraceae bacterium]|nr:iron ABC transporter permease [Lachnospiraceae bacterium]